MNDICHKISSKLHQDFDIVTLEVIDDTHKHKKHKSFIPGKHHITIKINAKNFTEKNLIESHRAINNSLRSFFQSDIHALSIKILQNY